jgi:hypothetical protein
VSGPASISGEPWDGATGADPASCEKAPKWLGGAGVAVCGEEDGSMFEIVRVCERHASEGSLYKSCSRACRDGGVKPPLHAEDLFIGEAAVINATWTYRRRVERRKGSLSARSWCRFASVWVFGVGCGRNRGCGFALGADA